jgi:hypothetical protein
MEYETCVMKILLQRDEKSREKGTGIAVRSECDAKKVIGISLFAAES